MRNKLCVTYTDMNKQIGLYGGNISVGRYMLTLFIWCLAVSLACFVYRIQWWFALGIIGLGIGMIPGLVVVHYRQKADMRRFSDIDVYIHQMAYSFLRTPKINQALKDSLIISEGKLKKTISKALDEMNYGMSNKVYEDALSIIEEEYHCNRVGSLHRFMIGIEQKGGRYTSALNILIEDFNRWASNVYRCQAEIRKIRRDTNIGIIISLVLAGMTTFMCNMLNTFDKGRVRITDSIIYQLTACGFLVLCMLFFTYCQCHYVYSWDEEERSDDKIARDYKQVYESKLNELTIKMLPVWLAFVAGACILFVMGRYLIGIMCVISVVVLVMSPYMNRNEAARRLKKDVYFGFTEWLRNLAISLEDKPLLAAVEDTYETCPVVMKNQLSDFIAKTEEAPKDIVPYYEFLSEFEIMDIQAAVRMLYGLGDLDKEESSRTIDALVRRNYALSDKAERTRYMDMTSVMRFAEYIPTFFVAMKMAVDMMLVVTMYL